MNVADNGTSCDHSVARLGDPCLEPKSPERAIARDDKGFKLVCHEGSFRPDIPLVPR
jgi:hypothetical protein